MSRLDTPGVKTVTLVPPPLVMLEFTTLPRLSEVLLLLKESPRLRLSEDAGTLRCPGLDSSIGKDGGRLMLKGKSELRTATEAPFMLSLDRIGDSEVSEEDAKDSPRCRCKRIEDTFMLSIRGSFTAPRIGWP